MSQSGLPEQVEVKPSSSTKVTRGHSCSECSQRKVKCDGKRPCSTCIRSSRSADCRSVRPIMAAARSPLEKALIRRLRHCEGLLAAHGISEPAESPMDEVLADDARPPGTEVNTPSVGPDDGHVIVQRGHHRFVDNAIWNPLGTELDDDYYSVLDEGQGDGFEELTLASSERLFLPLWTLNDPTASHEGPDISQILSLWQVFLDNFDPLTKIFHAPTVQRMISEAVASASSHTGRKSIRALMSAIFLCAVTTLQDEDCIAQFNEPKKILLHRFSCMTQQALVGCELLKSTDPVILQALTLFLLASRRHIDEQSHWLLTGLATRLAQTMGMHREHSLNKFSPFEAELRRRLWWQIVIMDDRSGQLLGARGGSTSVGDADAKVPVNVNDSDLSSFMREPLVGKSGPTEMLFCTIRLQIGLCMRRLKMAAASSATLESQEAIVDAFEKVLETHLNQCDPSIPMHLLSVSLGRSAICQMRFSVLKADRNQTPEIRGRLFGLALQILQYDSLTYSNKSLQKFLWHVGNSFPFQALIHVLIDLPERAPDSDDVQQAWLRVNRAYEDHPELFNDTQNPLYYALGTLTLKAWSRYAQATSQLSCDLGRSLQMESHATAARFPAIIHFQTHRANRAAGPNAQSGNKGDLGPAFDLKMFRWAENMDGNGFEQLDLEPDMELYSQFMNNGF